jgi:hypothetical protein
MNRPESEDTVERVVRDAVERGRHLRRRRYQARVAVTGTLAAALVAGMLVLVTTAGSSKSPSGTKVTTASSPSTTAAPPTSTTPSHPSDTVPVADRIPADFQPSSFTAVSLQQWWLLGTATCSSGSGTCNAIVRTTNSGSSFTAISSPPAGAVAQVAFAANASDGYAFDPQLWETTNGGSSWSSVEVSGVGLSGATVSEFQVAGNKAYALVCPAASGSGNCQAPQLLSSVVGSSAWQKVTMPVALSYGASFALGGANLYILSGNLSSKPVLLYSSDGGASFTQRVDPCTPGLGGTLTTSADGSAGSATLWAACPTGTQAGTWLSTSGGASWQRRASGFDNALQLTAASATVALAWPAGAAASTLERTSNGGTSFSVVLSPSSTARVTWAGFSDTSRAYALVQSGSGSMILYESNDGGATWSVIAIKS